MIDVINLKIKTPELSQLPEIVALDQISLGGLWTLAGYKRELESPNSHFLALSICFGETQEAIIGFGGFWAILEEAHITVLAIHPEYQGHGLGKLLLYNLLDKATVLGLERATLEVRSSNEVALSLYQKFGFKMAGRRKGYYQGTGEDALILWRGDLQSPQFRQELVVWRNQWADDQLFE